MPKHLAEIVLKMNIEKILLVISITFSRSQLTQEHVCYGDTQNTKCRLNNIEILLQNQAETMQIVKFNIKDCSDLLHSRESISGVYSIYTRYSRYMFYLFDIIGCFVS